MRRRIALVAVLVLTAIPLLAAPVAARDGQRAEHARIVRYWTSERLRAAIPRDFVKVGPSYRAKPAKPPGGGGGDGGSTVTGASWTKGGAILKASGKVFFTMGSSNYVCSGAVAQDSRSGYSLVLTAAHCAYDEVAEAFATNWMFIPEYDTAPSTCASTVWGCWTAQGLVVHSKYATAGSFNEQATVHDYAFAVVAGGGKTDTDILDVKVGSFPIAFSGVSSGNRLYAFGYPAAGRYKGKDLTYCAGNIFTDQYNSDLTWGMACNMTGGSSGGPWLSSFSETTGSGTLSSVNSYGYSGLSNMYGPKFNAATASVHSAANGATGDTIVP